MRANRRSKSRKSSGDGSGLGVFLICSSVIERTLAVLSESGQAGAPHEGVVYWAGLRVPGRQIVTTCVAPAAKTTYGSFDTSSAANARVVMYLAGAGLELLGQVHSHPGNLVDHSMGDDERAFMPYEGFLSVVVPDYARQGMLPLRKCGVHVFERGEFRRLTDSEVEAKLQAVPAFEDLR
jgi:hypothetical protein